MFVEQLLLVVNAQHSWKCLASENQTETANSLNWLEEDGTFPKPYTTTIVSGQNPLNTLRLWPYLQAQFVYLLHSVLSFL